ncbi:hypothetical protein C7974DRAFT_40866 [Boeremia exigua]|uniref:uncharacterized protein n=1 Tax=Boeremia exigua TaxID=749465 RepID=UPI001E8E64B5|nr:uncharacterized protein C7974DRAFT_40866 [Boeremia exigua]KAH6619048.1 hypothetical protein C7974DRAFT_40866 [Boeremia exigua]
MENSTLLNAIPLEIRNNIYSNILIKCAKFDTPRHCTGSPFILLARSLPGCLLLCRQTLEEASLVYLQQTVVVYRYPGYSGLRDFLESFPNKAGYSYVRRLAHMHPQSLSATLRKSRKEMAEPRFFGDIVSFCNGLRELHLNPTVPSAFFLRYDYSQSVDAFANSAEMQLVFANPYIRSLEIICDGGAITEQSLKMFKTWFRQECRNRETTIDLRVKVTAKPPGDPERYKINKNGVEVYCYHDFFG